MSWLCTVSADLFINKPLGLAPQGIELKRAHLYDINPVGLSGMAGSAAIALAAHFGVFGATLASLSTYLTLTTFLITPAIAIATKGRYYLARKPRREWQNLATVTCSICEHAFEPEDMAWCPAYAAPICSLCCSLDSRCHDMCKPNAHLNAQVQALVEKTLPAVLTEKLGTRLGRYGVSVFLSISGIGVILAVIAYQ